MKYMIEDGTEKDIECGDFAEISLPLDSDLNLFQVSEVFQDSSQLVIEVKNNMTVLSSSFIKTVWRKL